MPHPSLYFKFLPQLHFIDRAMRRIEDYVDKILHAGGNSPIVQVNNTRQSKRCR